MRILRNSALVFKLAFRYAPWNALLLILGFYIPGFFGGLQIILVQRVVDAGLAYVAGEGQNAGHMRC
ncbi:MAG: hypothetical protein J5986_03680 [Roseburia sp.]|nr:hypothetical protein [Roseburia sp.]